MSSPTNADLGKSLEKLELSLADFKKLMIAEFASFKKALFEGFSRLADMDPAVLEAEYEESNRR